MPATPLSHEAVKIKLASIQEGSRVTIKYERTREVGVLISRTGTLFKTGSSWVIKPTAASAMRLPSEGTNVYEIEVIEASSRSNSRRRVDEFDDEVIGSAIPLGEEGLNAQPAIIIDEGSAMYLDRPANRRLREAPPPAEDRLPEQRHAEQPRRTSSEGELLKQMVEMMKMQQEQHASTMKQMLEALKPLRNAPELMTQQGNQVAPGSDITQMMVLGDALRGTEDPRWRIAPGLLTPKYLVERFKIVSIPHLLFKEDPSTHQMVKVPKGDAMKIYKAILPTCKMAFPNHQATSQARKGKGDQNPGVAMKESAEGLRAELDRAERMFAALLEQLDQQDAEDLPSTREQWMVFIDAGAQVLGIYATMAVGYLHGGAKVAVNYNLNVTTKGVFDPVKLWPDEASFRRKSQ